MKRTAAASDLETLADTLWAERRVVEYLLFKLITVKLVLAADERRLLTSTVEEVERMLQTLRATEVQRAAALETVAHHWGIPSEHLTLRELAERSPEPMAGVFRDHQEAFAHLMSDIGETARENRRLASASLASIRKMIDVLAGPDEDGPTVAIPELQGVPRGRGVSAGWADGFDDALGRAVDDQAGPSMGNAVADPRLPSSETPRTFSRDLARAQDADTRAIIDLHLQHLALRSSAQALSGALPSSLATFLR